MIIGNPPLIMEELKKFKRVSENVKAEKISRRKELIITDYGKHVIL